MSSAVLDAAKTALFPEDGYKSRKFLYNAAVIVVVEAAATWAFLLADPFRMTASEWTTMNMWLVPIALTIHAGGNLIEKHLKAKAA